MPEFFALARLSPDYVPFDTLRAVPLDPRAPGVLRVCKEDHNVFRLYSLPPVLLHPNAEARTLDAQQVGDIVQSIMLHTSQWPCGKSSATAFFDVARYDAMGPDSFDFLLNRKTFEEIEKEYPQGNLVPQTLEVMKREFAEKPNCLLSHLPGGLDALIKINRLA